MPRYYKDRLYCLTDRKRIGFLNRVDMINREAKEEARALCFKTSDELTRDKISHDMATFRKIETEYNKRSKI